MDEKLSERFLKKLKGMRLMITDYAYSELKKIHDDILLLEQNQKANLSNKEIVLTKDQFKELFEALTKEHEILIDLEKELLKHDLGNNPEFLIKELDTEKIIKKYKNLLKEVK